MRPDIYSLKFARIFSIVAGAIGKFYGTFARLVVVGISLSLTSFAAPLLHEYIPPDPQEDALWAAVTLTGGFPASLSTPVGIVAAPDMLRPPSATGKAYASGSSGESDVFHPDRDTRRPSTVSYDDPFSPTVTPYKRLSAFDRVMSDSSLRVASPTLVPVSIGGVAVPADESFYAEMNVDFVPGEPARIPTPGPGAKALKIHTVPAVEVTLLRDGAENWFLRAGTRTRVRLLLTLAVPRASFGGARGNPRWNDLPRPVPLPPVLQQQADDVNSGLGVTRTLSPRDALGRLVAYYRSFTETSEPLPARQGIFVDVAKSRKGVCRHRAFAFVVSSLALGLPARLVTNEAHTWVESFDGNGWRRLDLGGAAADFEDPAKSGRVAHIPPADPYPWPPTTSSAHDVVTRAQGIPSQVLAASAASSGVPLVPLSVTASAGSASPLGPRLSVPDDRPASRLTWHSTTTGPIYRQQPVAFEGHVEGPNGGCAGGQVMVRLTKDKQTVAWENGGAGGNFLTDDDGNFRGSLVVPATAGVGHYDLQATFTGSERCAPSEGE